LSLEILVIIVFSLMFFTPTETKAYNDYAYLRTEINLEAHNPIPNISSIKPNSINIIKSKITITIFGSGFTTDSIVKKNNSNRRTTFIDSKHLLVDIYASDMYNQNEFYLTVFNREPGGGYSNASLFTIKNDTTTTNTTTTTTNTTTINNSSSSNNSNNNSNSNYDNTSNRTEENNNVSASDSNENYGSLTANAFLGSDSFMPTGLVQWIVFVIIILLIIFLWRYVHRSEEKYMGEPLKHA